MKKIYELEDLDCAACAAKIEEAIKNIDGVEDISVNFIMQSMTVSYSAYASEKDVFEQIKKCTKKIEPDCVIKG